MLSYYRSMSPYKSLWGAFKRTQISPPAVKQPVRQTTNVLMVSALVSRAEWVRLAWNATAPDTLESVGDRTNHKTHDTLASSAPIALTSTSTDTHTHTQSLSIG